MRVGELVQSVAKHKALLYVFITSLAARVEKNLHLRLLFLLHVIAQKHKIIFWQISTLLILHRFKQVVMLCVFKVYRVHVPSL
jgi:hypothetical protein